MLKASPLQIKAYQHLRKMIDEELLVDDTIYSETKMAEQLGISRTPMRDALQRLEQEGFIEILPSRGFRLQKITPEQILKNFQVRSALEGYCALNLTQNRHTDQAKKVIKRLKELLEHQEKICSEQGDLADFVRCDLQFHLAIVESLDNAELSQMFSNHLYCIQKLARKSLLHPGRVEETLSEHRAIYDAICAGDVANVYNITMLHMHTAAEINMAELT